MSMNVSPTTAIYLKGQFQVEIMAEVAHSWASNSVYEAIFLLFVFFDWIGVKKYLKAIPKIPCLRNTP
jgi:hypothetical protein